MDSKLITYCCPYCSTIAKTAVAIGTRRYMATCGICGNPIMVKVPRDKKTPAEGVEAPRAPQYEYHALEIDTETKLTVTCPKCGNIEEVPKLPEAADWKTYEYNCNKCGLRIIAHNRG